MAVKVRVFLAAPLISGGLFLVLCAYCLLVAAAWVAGSKDPLTRAVEIIRGDP